MKILKMGLGLFGLLIGTITVIAVVRAMSLKPSPMTTIAPLVLREVGQDLVAARLSTAVQYKTVTTQDPAETDWAKFIEFQTWLTETYPDFYGVLDTQMVETYTPVHQWVGTDPALPPLIMLAHQDVVPALESDVGWDYPPFAGVRDGGYIYGRGTLDDKGSLMGLHEAGNYLAAQGWQPERTIYFIFGHDEEVSGSGALAAAKLLQSRGVDPLAVIDEGGAIIRDFNGLEKPLSLIGVAEKGYFTVKLTASAQGGHSSSPPDVTAIGA